MSRPRWNMFVGSIKNKKIGFVNVCWAPMAALVVHKFAAMGTKRFIQIGYCGGLTPSLKYGEVLVVSSAKSEDGVATQYFPNENEFSSSKGLVSQAVEILKKENFPHQVGKIVSTSAMFLETDDVVKKWNAQGFVGVDGETAATFAVAAKFHAESISLLTCSDNLALGDNYYESNENRNSVPVVTVYQSASPIVLSPDHQKILVHVDAGSKPDSGKKLLYNPLDGKSSYVINSPAFKDAYLFDPLFFEDSKTVLFRGKQLPGDGGVYRWSAP